MAINNLESAIQTSVKFYASLTRNQAKGIDSIGNDNNGNPIYVEPGAVCFVSDEQGNSIFVNTKLFGDGAISGGGGGGGITEVNLSDIVVVEKDGQILKTLADYFSADGSVISNEFKVTTTKTNLEGTEYQMDIVVINQNGITINESKVITEADLEKFKQEVLGDVPGTVESLINSAEQNAKDYADTLIASVYKIKGSVNSYSELINIQNPTAGDVYNVIQEHGESGTSAFVPAGTNYVYVAVTNQQDSKYPGYWDPLGGTIDLSAYKTAANTTVEIQTALSEAKTYTNDAISEVNEEIVNINNGLNAFDQRINTNASNINTALQSISDNAQNIETNTTNITNIVTQLTWQ